MHACAWVEATQSDATNAVAGNNWLTLLLRLFLRPLLRHHLLQSQNALFTDKSNSSNRRWLASSDVGWWYICLASIRDLCLHNPMRAL
jgi:hypothetical protein